MVALLVKGGNVIDYGYNHVAHHPEICYFNRSMHAEAHLVRKRPKCVRGGKVFIYRFNAADETLMPRISVPCLLCQHTLGAAGVGRVESIGPDGTILKQKSHDLAKLKTTPARLTRWFIQEFDTLHHGAFDPMAFLA